MDSKANSLNWFDIPANDINRAKTFYENIFDIKMDKQEMMGMKMAFFPAEAGSGKANGCIAQSSNHKPSTDGAIVYLNANPSMDGVLKKIEAAGGKVVMPKTKINDDIGHMAFFIDSEGNKVALHSQN